MAKAGGCEVPTFGTMSKFDRAIRHLVDAVRDHHQQQATSSHVARLMASIQPIIQAASIPPQQVPLQVGGAPPPAVAAAGGWVRAATTTTIIITFNLRDCYL